VVEGQRNGNGPSGEDNSIIATHYCWQAIDYLYDWQRKQRTQPTGKQKKRRVKFSCPEELWVLVDRNAFPSLSGTAFNAGFPSGARIKAAPNAVTGTGTALPTLSVLSGRVGCSKPSNARPQVDDLVNHYFNEHICAGLELCSTCAHGSGTSEIGPLGKSGSFRRDTITVQGIRGTEEEKINDMIANAIPPFYHSIIGKQRLPSDIDCRWRLETSLLGTWHLDALSSSGISLGRREQIYIFPGTG
jgi:hypothetical protein